MRRLTRRQHRAALVLALVAVLFCALDLVGAPLSGARSGVQGFFGALYRGTDSVAHPTRQWLAALPHLGGSAATIEQLRARNAELQRQLATRRGDAATAAQIGRLQAQASRGGYRVTPARVTAIGPGGGFDWTVTLDAGRVDGVRVDQSVIAGPELVGRVLRVADTSAVVLLAADPGSGVGVRDLRSGELGLVTGRGRAGFTFAPLDATSVVRAGDPLVSGPAARTTYVPGLTVGRVGAVRRGPDGTATATVIPAVRPATLDVVGVVLVGGRTTPRPALSPAGPPPRNQAAGPK